MQFKSLAKFAAIPMVATAVFGLSALPAFASTRAGQACTLTAKTPYVSTTYYVSSEGGRTGCTNTVAWVRVSIVRDIDYLPDRVEHSITNNFVNSVTIKPTMQGVQGNAYYTRTESSTGAKLESSKGVQH